MTIKESLMHELPELTRLYAFAPYNSIFMFVSYRENQTLEYFEKNIASKLTYQLGYGKVVQDLLQEIRSELTPDIKVISE